MLAQPADCEKPFLFIKLFKIHPTTLLFSIESGIENRRLCIPTNERTQDPLLLVVAGISFVHRERPYYCTGYTGWATAAANMGTFKIG